MSRLMKDIRKDFIAPPLYSVRCLLEVDGKYCAGFDNN